jgi:GTP-binding protein
MQITSDNMMKKKPI